MCSCDFDSPAVFVVETRKAAKDHPCSECDRGIHKGDLYEHTFSVWEGEPASNKFCADCATVIKLMRGLEPGFCWQIGTLHEAVSECLRSCEAWETAGEKRAA
jgi:hypothetical protein